MTNLLAHFEPTELVDFMNFIGLLIHKLRVSVLFSFLLLAPVFISGNSQQDMFDVMDQLIGPLNNHITDILSQPITGTDDQRAHMETKKAYLALLNNIMAANLPTVFISEREWSLAAGRSNKLLILHQETLVRSKD